MKKVLLLALVLTNTIPMRADETSQDGDYETLTKVAAAALTIGAIGAALYVGKGNVMGALRSVRAEIPQGVTVLPRPGFSKKALAFAGIAGFGAGFAAVVLILRVVFSVPGHVQLKYHAARARKFGREDHADLLDGFSDLLTQMSMMGGRGGALARMLISHTCFVYRSGPIVHFEPPAPPPVQRLIEDKDKH